VRGLPLTAWNIAEPDALRALFWKSQTATRSTFARKPEEEILLMKAKIGTRLMQRQNDPQGNIISASMVQ
jgi:hypothetical protein